MIMVRAETPPDQAGIQEVRAAATATLRETYRPRQAAVAAKARMEDRLTRLVAVAQGRVVGTLQYYREGRSLCVVGLGVLPDYRRQGVARSLLRSVEKLAPGERAIRLRLYTVKETGNVEVFRRLGFAVAAEREADIFESDRFERLTEVTMMKPL